MLTSLKSSFLGALLFPFARKVVRRKVVQVETADEHLQGVGVLRYPGRYVVGDRPPREIAREIAEQIRPGGILLLPNTPDERGRYAWDFTIVGGDPGQVQVERGDKDDAAPEIPK